MTLVEQNAAKVAVESISQYPIETGPRGGDCLPAGAMSGTTRRSRMRLSARLNPARRRRHWVLQRWDETPSWLTSLVFHMTVIIVLGSLTLHADRNRTKLRPLLLTMSQSAGQPIVETPVVLEPEPIDVGVNQQLDNPRSAQQSHEFPQLAIDPFDVEQSGRDPTAEDNQQFERLASAATAATDISEFIRPAASQSGSGTEDARRQRELDHIVDRFIQYDIGQLRGAEGMAARQAFTNLGDDAIPALVRGLNRSAYISASCPVVVISRKLTSALNSAEDPRSLQYTIENLGRDVPRNAPHASVLRKVRAKALAMQEMRDWHQRLVDAGHDISWREFKQLAKLSSEGPKVLANHLRSPNGEMRLAALNAIGIRASQLDTKMRIHLGKNVSELLDDDDPRVRAAALMTLSQLAPLAAGQIEDQADRSQAARSWRAYWAGLERTTIAAHAAENQFRMAQNLAGAGKFDIARRRYRRLIQKYPDTAAATAASQELSRLGEL